MRVAEPTVTSADPSGVAVADVSAIAAGLERLVVDFDKVRRSALRGMRVKPLEAYLLRLAARPEGTRLGLFRDQLGITEARASQIARALEEKQFVGRNRDRILRRVCVVSATRKGRNALARCDAQLAEALRAELAKGDASSLRQAMAELLVVAAASAQVIERPEDRKQGRTRKRGARSTGPTLFDPVSGAPQCGAPEIVDLREG